MWFADFALDLSAPVVNAVTLLVFCQELHLALCMSGSVVHQLIDVRGATSRKEVCVSEKRGQGGV